MVDAAAQYAAMGWPVCMGAFPPGRTQHAAFEQRACSCDRIGCPAPGAHPMSPAWQLLASTDEAAKKQWLTEEETFIRRVINQLMEAYQFGSTATAAA